MDSSHLDALSAVLGAIAASAGAGAGDVVKDMTKTAITQTRDRLIDLTRRRLKKDPVGDARLTVYAVEPTPANGQALQAHLVDAGVESDQEILTLAHELLRAAGSAALAPGSVAANVISQINRDGGTGFIGGQHIHHYGARPDRVAWELYRLAGEGYELRNTGPATATDVDITANVELTWPRSPDRGIPAGCSVMFICSPSLADPSPVLTVSYSTPGGPERLQWKRPLPK